MDWTSGRKNEKSAEKALNLLIDLMSVKDKIYEGQTDERLNLPKVKKALKEVNMMWARWKLARDRLESYCGRIMIEDVTCLLLRAQNAGFSIVTDGTYMTVTGPVKNEHIIHALFARKADIIYFVKGTSGIKA